MPHQSKPPHERVIVGLGVFAHDTSIAIMRGGEVLFAAEQERFDRLKHSRQVPVDALQAGLVYTGLKASEIDDFIVNFDPTMVFVNYTRHIWNHLPRTLRMLFDAKRYQNVWQTGAFKSVLIQQLRLDPTRIRWHYVPHHVTHAASAFFRSPFEQAAVLSSDALGEFDSVYMGIGNGLQLSTHQRIPYPHSVGAVYSAVTDYLGFKIFSGEGTVMGLAGFGTDRFKSAFSRLIHLEEDGMFSIDTRMFQYHVLPWVHHDWVSPAFLKQFGPKRLPNEPINDRHADVAAGVQYLADLALLHFCRYLDNSTRCKNLCYAGGVALNGYGNTRILSETGFQNLWIQPAANDGGTSLGAALYHSHHTLQLPRKIEEGNTFLGPSYSNEQCEQALGQTDLTWTKPTNLEKTVAQRLWQNRIVGWFEDRMELGPRALGHRSILANPCHFGMKDHLNLRVKHREPFRPFAPLVPEEVADRYFEMPCRRSPYMLLIVKVRPEWRDKLPAITHIDGTARVQTVDSQTLPRLHRLLWEFEKLSGVPILLNTSFNGPGEPIVCSPEDAIRSYTKHGLDDLVLEDFLCFKPVRGES